MNWRVYGGCFEIGKTLKHLSLPCGCAPELSRAGACIFCRWVNWWPNLFSKRMHCSKCSKGLELVKLDHVDECCGFGGTFWWERIGKVPRMGTGPCGRSWKNNVQVITSGDMSCRCTWKVCCRKKSNIVVKHIAEILVSGGGEWSNGEWWIVSSEWRRLTAGELLSTMNHELWTINNQPTTNC